MIHFNISCKLMLPSEHATVQGSQPDGKAFKRLALLLVIKCMPRIKCPSISINACGFRFACLQTTQERQILRYFGHIQWRSVATENIFGEYPTNFGTSIFKSEGELNLAMHAWPFREQYPCKYFRMSPSMSSKRTPIYMC